MRICTGAILDFPMPEKLTQLDVIIWSPFPVPAVFESQGFGLVPRSSAFGVLEVKRSNYPDAISDLDEFSRNIGSVFDPPHGAVDDFGRTNGMGVVSVLTQPPCARLQTLISEQKAVAIFDATGEVPTVRAADVLTLTNFLFRVSWRHHMQKASPGCPQVITDALSITPPAGGLYS
jgi:hypothetical protein